jgi:hypothetical protein
MALITPGRIAHSVSTLILSWRPMGRITEWIDCLALATHCMLRGALVYFRHAVFDGVAASLVRS